MLVRRATRLISAAIVLVALASPAAAQSVSGVVREAGTGEPIIGARVTLLADSLRRENVVIADSTGRFAFSPRTRGRYAVRAERIGFRPRSTAAFVLSDSLGELVIPLEAIAQRLSGVSSIGTGPRGLDFMRGFERRRLRGMGSYMARDDIAQRGASVVTELLRGMIGMELMVDDAGNLIARTSRGERSLSVSRDGPCKAPIYVDGIERVGESLDRMVSPANIEAIEVYSGASNLPVEFRQGDSACGVVFIWTRSSAAAP